MRLPELDLAEARAPRLQAEMRSRCALTSTCSKKKWKEAAEALTPCCEPFGCRRRIRKLATWLGHVKIELHDYPTAIKLLNQVYNRRIRKPLTPCATLANAFFLNKDYSAAIGAMDQLAKMEPPTPVSWFVRAICYDKLSHKVEAIDAYQKFLDQDNAQHDTQDFQARHRILTLQGELGQSHEEEND